MLPQTGKAYFEAWKSSTSQNSACWGTMKCQTSTQNQSRWLAMYLYTYMDEHTVLYTQREIYLRLTALLSVLLSTLFFWCAHTHFDSHTHRFLLLLSHSHLRSQQPWSDFRASRVWWYRRAAAQQNTELILLSARVCMCVCVVQKEVFSTRDVKH